MIAESRAIVKTLAVIALVCFVLGFLAGILLPHCGEKKEPALMTSIDAEIPKHDVELKAPIKALDKKELKRRKIIPQSAIENRQAEVLATATIEDDSGTLYAGAVLNADTGETRIVSRRPIAEALWNNRIGIGGGIGDAGVERAVMYERTFFRLGDLFGSAEFNLANTDSDHTRWRVMAWLTYRF